MVDVATFKTAIKMYHRQGSLISEMYYLPALDAGSPISVFGRSGSFQGREENNVIQPPTPTP